MDERMEKSSMDAEKAALLEYAAMLSQLGVGVGRARDYLRRLGERAVAHDTNAMRQAVRDYREAKSLFDNLEAHYLALRDGIGRK